MRFLGLWDTVAAYGLPMAEMTRAVDLYFWPMSMRDRKLHENVERACHALALDDERTTFHPLLWNENGEHRIFPGSESQPITHTGQERISQVWFPGMHANLGGGYPDDGMAHVPLVWILGEAEKWGLKLKTNVLDKLKIAGDPSGRIYNSRQGLAGYYRYSPRPIDMLIHDKNNKVEVELPKIHESVFDRLRSGVGAYAPFVLPKQYAIVRWDGTIVPANVNPYEDSTQAPLRLRKQENVWDWVWARRVVFFATFFATLYVAASPLSEKVTTLIQKASWIDGLLTNAAGRLADLSHSKLSGTRAALSWLPDSAPFVNNVFWWIEHITCVIVPPVIDLAAVALPGFLKPWLDAYKHNPTWIAIWGCIIALLIAIGSWMENQIHANMREIWNPIVESWDPIRAWDPTRAWDLKPIAAPPAVDLVAAPRKWPRKWLYLMRASDPSRKLIDVMKYYVLPTFFAALFLIVGLAAVEIFWLALVE